MDDGPAMDMGNRPVAKPGAPEGGNHRELVIVPGNSDGEPRLKKLILQFGSGPTAAEAGVAKGTHTMRMH